MTPKFTVHITLGNAAMQEPAHVAWALREVAEKVQQGADMGHIHDWNGNNVGSFYGDFEDDEGESI